MRQIRENEWFDRLEREWVRQNQYVFVFDDEEVEERGEVVVE